MRLAQTQTLDAGKEALSLPHSYSRAPGDVEASNSKRRENAKSPPRTERKRATECVACHHNSSQNTLLFASCLFCTQQDCHARFFTRGWSQIRALRAMRRSAEVTRSSASSDGDTTLPASRATFATSPSPTVRALHNTPCSSLNHPTTLFTRTGTYMARFGRPLCRTCYQRLFGPYCDFCNEPVAGACVEPRPGLCFHPPHFVCRRCGASLSSGFVQRGNEYLCPGCGGQR